MGQALCLTFSIGTTQGADSSLMMWLHHCGKQSPEASTSVSDAKVGVGAEQRSAPPALVSLPTSPPTSPYLPECFLHPGTSLRPLAPWVHGVISLVSFLGSLIRQLENLVYWEMKNTLFSDYTVVP